jgi:HTH-type transcriptional regulator/antitoxin HigA
VKSLEAGEMKTKMKTTLRPFRPIKPGEILEEELDSRGWTSAYFAYIIGRPNEEIKKIIAGKKAITPDAAIVFSRVLGTSAEYWSNLEGCYRLDFGRQP